MTNTPVSAAPVVLSVEHLRREFAGVAAVDDLSFEVRRGECYGLLGPNGAGKSTTLKLALGLLTPDGGSITLLGHPIPGQARAARARVGVVPQNDALDPDFTASENLLVFGRYFGMSSRQTSSRIDSLLEFAGLSHKRDAKIQELSGGMKRRLTLARALINDPDILFLDEPTTGLDPQARHLIWDRLKRLLAQGKTIVLTTHFMEEAERLCHRLLIMDNGRMIAQDSPVQLIARTIEPFVFEVTGDAVHEWAQTVTSGRLAERVEEVGETAFVYCTDPAIILNSLAPYPALRTLQRPATLEDVFLKLTGRDLRD